MCVCVCVCVCFFNFFFLLIFHVMSGRPRRDMSSSASGNNSSLLFCTTLLALMSLSRVAVFLGDFICPNLMNLKNPCPSLSMSMVLGTLPLILRAWLARRVRNGSNLYVTLTSHYLILTFLFRMLSQVSRAPLTM